MVRCEGPGQPRAGSVRRPRRLTRQDSPLEPVDSGRKSRGLAIGQLLVSQGWLQLACSTRGSLYSVEIERTRSGAERQRLSPGEFSITRLFAHGLSSKEVGAELSLADSTARGALLRACKQLGVRAAQLPLFWHTLESATPVCQVSAGGGERLHYELDVASLTLRSLTACERTLLLQILLGRSNLEIARCRGGVDADRRQSAARSVRQTERVLARRARGVRLARTRH